MVYRRQETIRVKMIQSRWGTKINFNKQDLLLGCNCIGHEPINYSNRLKYREKMSRLWGLIGSKRIFTMF